MTLSPTDWVRYGLLTLVAFLVVKRIWTVINARRKIPALLTQGAVVIDVRSQSEFAVGNAAGSRNIPLNEIERGARSLDPKRWIIVWLRIGRPQRDGTALAASERVPAGAERGLLAKFAVIRMLPSAGDSTH